MPQRPLRPCARPGCPQLVTPPERYCEAHAKVAAQQEAERERLYDRQQRDPRVVEFYHSPAWRALREQALARDAYLCQPCLREKRITRADTVHHIVPIEEAWERRLDLSNVESVCRACHNRIHGEHQKGPRLAKVTLVCGPPGSGKTTYVRERMRPGDLVVDLDALYSALSGLPWYQKPPELLPFVAEARDAVLRRLERPSGVEQAWVIATAPRRAEREALRQRLNAELVVLAVPAEECKRRIREDPARSASLEDWDSLVDRWWAEYEQG